MNTGDLIPRIKPNLVSKWIIAILNTWSPTLTPGKDGVGMSQMLVLQQSYAKTVWFQAQKGLFLNDK